MKITIYILSQIEKLKHVDLHDQYYQRRLYREQCYDDNKVYFKSSIDSIKPSKLMYLYTILLH
jgi:hypothetical protein